MQLLTDTQVKTISELLPYLNGGFKSHALELLANRDPTGGVVSIDDQVKCISDQYTAIWENIDDVYELWQDEYEIRDNLS